MSACDVSGCERLAILDVRRKCEHHDVCREPGCREGSSHGTEWCYWHASGLHPITE